jgi:hypothetical protein
MRFRLSAPGPAATAIPMTTPKAGSTRSSRTRSLPAPTPATGSARPFPLPAAAGRSAVNGRNGILNSLRSSKEQGQSNFNNPGTDAAGRGADFDLTPELRLSANANHLWFENTATLQALRNEGSIPRTSAGTCRPRRSGGPRPTRTSSFRLSPPRCCGRRLQATCSTTRGGGREYVFGPRQRDLTY